MVMTYHPTELSTKEYDMIRDKLEEILAKRKISVHVFFKEAKRWKYGQNGDCTFEVLSYEVSRIIPSYAHDYIIHIYYKEIREDEIIDDMYLADVQGRGD